MASTQEYYIIDGNAYIYRAFFALPPFSTSYGMQTNAIYGFTKMLLGLVKSKPNAQIIVAFDHKKKSFRHDLYKEYKAHRAKMPEEMISQLPAIKELPQHFCLPSLEIEGVEADDAIASFVAQHQDEPNSAFYIITGDKDMMQLVQDNVFIYDTMKNIVYDREGVKTKMGVFPEQIADLLGMMGDSSDNIPGIPGVGPKTAQKLLETYPHIEDVLAHADEQKGALATKLHEHAELARLSKELATVKRDIDLSSMDFSVQEKSYSGLEDFCRTYEFGSLLKEVMELTETKIESTDEDSTMQEEIYTESSDPELTLESLTSPCFVEIISTEEQQSIRLAYDNSREYMPLSILTEEIRHSLLKTFSQRDFIVLTEDMKALWKVLHTAPQENDAGTKPQATLF